MPFVLFQETGWIPQHMIARDEHKDILGVVPLYLKRFKIFFFLLVMQSFSFFFFSCEFHPDTSACLQFAPLFIWLYSHSYGEYVFDHAWADAYYSYGSRYYPKLQCCVPFTPVTGQRFLLRDTPYKDQVFNILVSAMKDLTAKVLMTTLFRFIHFLPKAEAYTLFSNPHQTGTQV